MDWVNRYYTAQARSFATSEVSDYHRQCANTLASVAGEPLQSALDLGSGNGAIALVLARRGVSVTAVELNDVDARIASELAESGPEDLTALHSDFYAVQLNRTFDLVYYWDGFGVGEDADQQRLLARVSTEWLGESGVAIIDVFSPDYWSAQSGKPSSYRSRHGEIWQRELGFDHDASRMVDRWTCQDCAADAEPRSQSLRCYRPDEIVELAREAGLTLRGITTNRGKAIIPDQMDAYLANNTSYLAVFQRSDSL